VVSLHFKSRQPVDLELWTVERETALFRRVFGKRLALHVSR
jgi:exopolyphosphatase / guanosine-5'-triphosphate,3'-diphosphate pyrophosphatase